MAAIAGDAPINLTRESNGGLAVELEFRIDAAPTADVSLLMQCRGQSARRLSGRQRVPGGGAGGQWSRLAIPLHCFEKAGVDMSKVTVPIALSTSGAMTVTLSSARIVSPVGPVLTCK
jgi:beta-glucosidase